MKDFRPNVLTVVGEAVLKLPGHLGEEQRVPFGKAFRQCGNGRGRPLVGTAVERRVIHADVPAAYCGQPDGRQRAESHPGRPLQASHSHARKKSHDEVRGQEEHVRVTDVVAECETNRGREHQQEEDGTAPVARGPAPPPPRPPAAAEPSRIAA